MQPKNEVKEFKLTSEERYGMTGGNLGNSASGEAARVDMFCGHCDNFRPSPSGIPGLRTCGSCGFFNMIGKTCSCPSQPNYSTK